MDESPSSARRVEEMASTDGRVVEFTAPTEARNPVPEGEPESPLGSPAQVPEAVQTAAKATFGRGRPRNFRFALFALLPVTLVIGAWLYVTGGAVMSTDNAYVQADAVGLSTDVAGAVVAVEVRENEQVKAGQVMFRLRPDSFLTALNGAQAQLDAVHDQILTMKATYKQALTAVDQAQADIPYFQSVFDRQKSLVVTNAVSRQAYDDAAHNLESAKQRLSVAKAQAEAALAQLGGNADQTIEKNPFYKQAQSAVDSARRDLADTIVRAPFDGIVTNVSALQVGSYLQAAQVGFNLVSTDHMWVTANPKETELTWVRPGQVATVLVDTYPGVEWKGVVESVNPASVSSFSLLPAQNATGNWVKVVQRIPMRVRIDSLDGKLPLRVGMSVTVDVDTGHPRGAPDFLKALFGRSDRNG